jgi:DNA topoisomerase-1
MNTENKEDITSSLSHEEVLELNKDMEQAAAVAALIYTSDVKPGINRIRKQNDFVFMYRNKPVTDPRHLERIRKLAIPPAWEDVWICPVPNGHLQATGKDARKRKQYKYHHQWEKLRNETKFHRLLEFGKQLPALRLKLEEDIASKGLNENKVIATVISLMERTYLRIGNNGYEKMYGSYGISTLKDKHVAINGHELHFSFKGKKGIEHEVSLKNKKLAAIVKACKEIPGKELFQYYDDEGHRGLIDSGKINQYIKDATQGDFTAKDFRTWAGTLNIISSLKTMEEAITEAEKKKKIVAAIDEVSVKLGNTRTVCKKYYVHPGIIKLYEEDKLKQMLDELDVIEEPDQTTGLLKEELVLMGLLEKMHT